MNKTDWQMAKHSEDEGRVAIHLTKNEALVLFEFLARFSETKKLKLEDHAEERVLWDICCDLETKLTEPLDVNYTAILAQARQFVRDHEKR